MEKKDLTIGCGTMSNQTQSSRLCNDKATGSSKFLVPVFQCHFCSPLRNLKPSVFLPGQVLSPFRPGNWCVTERFLQGHCEWVSCTISMWNSLPHGIIHAECLAEFKKLLTMYTDNMNRVGLKKQKREF